MCGICFSLSPSSRLLTLDERLALPPPTPPAHLSRIKARGPDNLQGHVHQARSHHILYFLASLLSVRGEKAVPQPLVCPITQSVLCWNGNLWRVSGAALREEENDTETMLRLLLAAPEGAVDQVLGDVEGEYAFVFYDAVRDRLWYCRDWLGRRSLLRKTDGAELRVASVGVEGEQGWEEVEAGGIWRVDVNDGTSTFLTAVQDGARKGEPVWRIPQLNTTVPSTPHKLTRFSPETSHLRKVLTEAVHLRVRDVPPPLRGKPYAVRLAVLFSGGLDCTTLARLTHDFLPTEVPVELLNVAFENPRIMAAREKTGGGINGTTDAYSACPDRITGLSSFQELRTVCPTREWRFVAINVPHSEVLAERSAVVGLMRPHDTEMDMSIALAFYFASRGSGTLLCPGHESDGKPYTSSARIVLSGLGADELLAGYSRHATAYARSSYEGLLKELELDVSRLGKRNLGRDDRVVSNWGREARYPFLDDAVVRWALETGVQGKCGFGEPNDGHAADDKGKKVLRLLAAQLEMVKAAAEKKRAVQFGARSAKMVGGRTKGTDVIE